MVFGIDFGEDHPRIEIDESFLGTEQQQFSHLPWKHWQTPIFIWQPIHHWFSSSIGQNMCQNDP